MAINNSSPLKPSDMSQYPIVNHMPPRQTVRAMISPTTAKNKSRGMVSTPDLITFSSAMNKSPELMIANNYDFNPAHFATRISASDADHIM
jgi:hypothetical protein